MKFCFLIVLIFTLIPFSEAQSLFYEGFLDTFYAYDFNQPRLNKRAYTTQPAKHNEPNVNLAYIGIKVKKNSIRSRLAFQSGESVEANTSEELRFIQEAFVGTKIGPKTWVDGGIFFSHIGSESWVSRQNLTYSRSLNLDYVPYFSTGVKIDHEIDPKRSLQIHLVNGWQNIRENNKSKSFGIQYNQVLNDYLSLTYNNFLGDEEVVPVPETGKYRSRFRGYHNFILKWVSKKEWELWTALDLGHQAQQQNKGIDGWGAISITLQKKVSTTEAFAIRGEYYSDPHQANISTGTDHGFQVSSASINFDKNLGPTFLWRTEWRSFKARDKIFPKRSKLSETDYFLVTSLAYWF